MNTKINIAVIFISFFMVAEALAKVYHVKTNGNDNNTGLSWGTAFKTIQWGIDSAGAGDDVWVGHGYYREFITHRDDVWVYGSFMTIETSLSQRPAFYRTSSITYLTKPTAEHRSIWTVPQTVHSGCIDGFNIYGGDAPHGAAILLIGSYLEIWNNTIYIHEADGYGGGIACMAADPPYPQTIAISASPLIRHNRIYSCLAKQYGGAIGAKASSPEIIDCEIGVAGGNRAYLRGGGIHYDTGPWESFGANITPKVHWCLITGNLVEPDGATADTLWGGGICLYALHRTDYSIDADIKLNIFDGNTVKTNFEPPVFLLGNGGGLGCYFQHYLDEIMFANNVLLRNSAWQGAGVHLNATWPKIVVVNNTFRNNNTDTDPGGGSGGGGGIRFGEDGIFGPPITNCPPRLANNIFAENSHYGVMGRDYDPNPKPSGSFTLRRNLWWNNSPSNTYLVQSCNQPGCPNSLADLESDPLFIDDYHISSRSPCVDEGSDSDVETSVDIDGQTRIFGEHVDIGADEVHWSSGTLSLGGFMDDASGISIPYRFVDQATGQTVHSGTLTIDQDGNYNMEFFGNGAYWLILEKMPHWLRKVISITISGTPPSLGDTTLINGDVDGDNDIDGIDYTLFRTAFGGIVGGEPFFWQPTWNENADLNESGEVDLADFLIIDQNMDKTGDPLPGPMSMSLTITRNDTKKCAITPLGGNESITIWITPPGCTPSNALSKAVADLYIGPAGTPEAIRTVSIWYKSSIGHRALEFLLGNDMAFNKGMWDPMTLPPHMPIIQQLQVIAVTNITDTFDDSYRSEGGGTDMNMGFPGDMRPAGLRLCLMNPDTDVTNATPTKICDVILQNTGIATNSIYPIPIYSADRDTGWTTFIGKDSTLTRFGGGFFLRTFTHSTVLLIK